MSPSEPSVTLVIPSGVGNPGWRVRDGSTLDGYKFGNGSAPSGPSVVRSAALREARSIRIVARATGRPLVAPLGSVGVRLTTGSPRNCAVFDAATVLVDRPGRFVAKGAVATGTSCDDAALGGSTTTSTSTSTDTSTTTQEMCTEYQCRFPGPYTIPCCPDSGLTCVITDSAYGVCLGSACRNIYEPCGPGTPEPGTCCPGLECGFHPFAL